MGLATIIIFGIALLLFLLAVKLGLNTRGNGLGISSMILGLIGVILGLGYAAEHWLLTASSDQKQQLAQRLADCPQVRADARVAVGSRLTIAVADQLIEACTDEYLRRSTSERVSSP